MTKVDLKPANLGISGWQAILPERVHNNTLEQDIDCDIAVIGGGFAGLVGCASNYRT